jgi:hypothetical protein
MYRDTILAVPAAILQNPALPTPIELARNMVMLEVMHYDFTGNIKKGYIVVHRLVMEDVRAFFRHAFFLRFPIHSVIPMNSFNWCDEDSCRANNSSGHNMRHIEGQESLKVKLSKHAIGCAFDINPKINACHVLDEKTLEFQYLIPANGTYHPGTPGTLYAEHPLVKLMIGRGWAWGGNWTFPKDYQHFQIVPPELAHYVQ